MRQVIAFKTFSDLKRHNMVLNSLEITIFQYDMKHSFIYLLVPVLSLGSFRLHIMCVGTIARQSTKG